jgi:hypothetical protein
VDRRGGGELRQREQGDGRQQVDLGRAAGGVWIIYISGIFVICDLL